MSIPGFTFKESATFAASLTDDVLFFGQSLVERANKERLTPLMEALNCLTVAALQLRAAAAAPPTCRDCDDTGKVEYDGETSVCPICEERALQARESKKED